MKQITVRDGKGFKDRYTVLPEAVIPALQEESAGYALMAWGVGGFRRFRLTDLHGRVV